MVALDSAVTQPSDFRDRTAYAAPIVLSALAVAVLLAVGTLLFEAKSSFAWGDAAAYVSRFSLVIFVAALVVEPLSRIFRVPFLKAVARERASLILAFVVVSFVSLACELLPPQLGESVMTLQAFAYAMLTVAILIVMLFSAHPSTIKVLGAPVWRTMQRIATSYFWVVFTVTALNHIVQPDVTDRWWGISLLLLIVAVLIRLADAVLFRMRAAAAAAAVSEKAA